LLGYKPLLIAITFERDLPAADLENICLSFHPAEFRANGMWREMHIDKNSVATLALKKLSVKKLGETTVIFYTGVSGCHTFIHPLQQHFNRVRESFRKNKKDNVSLPGNLYDMVRIAYAVPRIIPIISVTDGVDINMFPTDLHGKISSEYYISSLRKDGVANHQVEQTGKLVLSDIESRSFKMAYAAGKNHMRPFRPLENFPWLGQRSQTYQIPLPVSATRYRELKLLESFDVGIHRIHLYTLTHAAQVSPGDTLAHIHQYYAQWREDHGQQTKMLLR
jgi:hypothetical protein